MEFFGYLSTFAIGITLGLIGGGGSILTVPLLVYLFHIDPILATSYSLFIVGTSSSIGAITYFRSKLIDFQTALYFGLPSIMAVFLTRLYIIDLLPQILFQIGTWKVSKSTGIMLFFSILMLFSAYRMISASQQIEIKKNSANGKLISLGFQGAVVGLLSGVVGAGGGFLIIPSLIMFNQMSIKKAVGTSLLIIAMNSLFGFIGKLDYDSIQWPFLLTISATAIMGILIGERVSQKIESKKLKPALGWFVLVMGLVIIFQELAK